VKEAQFPRLRFILSWNQNKKSIQSKLNKMPQLESHVFKEDSCTPDNITLAEFKVYMAVIIVCFLDFLHVITTFQAMKLNHQPSFQDYFSKNEPIFGNEFISNLMTLQQFHKINSQLHYNVVWLINKINSKFQVYYLYIIIIM